MNEIPVMFAICFAALFAGAEPAPPILQPAGRITFHGNLKEDKDLSGIARVGDWLLVVSDETDHVAVLRMMGDKATLSRNILLGNAGEEIDLEAITTDGSTVYAIGSHGGVRKPKGSVKFHPARDAIYRFTLKADGSASPPERMNLRAVIDNDPLLKPFSRMPCKEGGVDIEGLAFREGRLHAGFRGPVLPGDLAVVVSFRFEDPASTAKLLRLPLGGLGIRDLAAVKDGFLLLAGPVGTQKESFRLAHWDGRDAPDGKVTLLGTVPNNGDAPEGLLLLAESDTAYEVLIVSDGVSGGSPTRYRLARP